MSRDAFLQDLPPDHAPPRTHAALAALLRANPGLWRLVGEYSSRNGAFSMASNIRTGNRQAWRPRLGGRYEADARTSKKGAHEVFARWVPTPTTTRSAA